MSETHSQKTSNNIRSRPLDGLDDYLRVHQLLIDSYPRYGTYTNWEPRRWEGQWYWGDEAESQKWASKVQLWETGGGDIVGAAHPEHTNGAFLQLHPDFRYLEAEMIDWAEANLRTQDDDGRPHLTWEVYDYDDVSQELLSQRGYTVQDGCGYMRWRDRDAPIPEVTVPDGYTIRSLRQDTMDDCAGWATVIGATFGHSFASAEGIARFQTSPSYRHDLHMIAEAPDGYFAAFAGLTVDDANHVALFEPVGTHPDHRRNHLAQAVMAEGMRRLAPFDVNLVYVPTGDAESATRLYDSMGFVNKHRVRTWVKHFTP